MPIMRATTGPTRWLEKISGHTAILIFTGMAMTAALIAKFVLHNPAATERFLLAGILGSSLPILFQLLREVVQGNFSVDLLAAISIVTAVILHEYWVAAIVILMLSGGQTLETYATRRASSVLGALAKRMPEIAHRVEADGAVEDVPSEQIAVGDQLMLYPHELCPVDGVVMGGLGSMDESYLTGEPYLMEKAPGTTVLSGAINGNSALTIRATKIASDSRYAKIVEVLHASEEDRPAIRRLGDRIGVWYTPLAVLIAIASWLLSGHPERFLAVLVIATPCPLLIAIPVAIIGAISVGARYGIVIKDPSILEKLDSCKTLIVDKTGTLTYGEPSLTEVLPIGPLSRTTLLQFAASLERYSKHPLAKAVLDAASREQIPLINAGEVSEAPGTGLTGQVYGHEWTLTGRGRIAEEAAQQLPPTAPGLECVLLRDGELAGVLRFLDEPRGESQPFLAHLGPKHAITEIVLLSGDRPAEVAQFASSMGLTHVYGGMSPEQKLDVVRKMTAQAPTLYLGDGINDAPAMMAATAGVALGVNSDITTEAAGAVILQSSLGSVDELMHIGRRMRRIAITSAVGGMLLSLAGMCAASLGYLTPIQGAIAQEAIDLLSILNSLRMILPVGQLRDFHLPVGAGMGT
ncbi:MAG: heavy metal translocating P-type ATPase [Acidobacteriaceae bacterium]